MSERLVAEHRERVAARLNETDAPMRALNAAAIPPDICGPEIPASPARGAYRVFRPVEIVPGSRGTARPSGYQGPGELRPRAAIAKADVFDAMRADAYRRHEAAGGDPELFIPPFTPGQEQVGRDYRDLTERHEAGGMKCASLETIGKGGGQGEFIDAFIAEGMRLAWMVNRIGVGAAMEVRRVRPSKRGVRARGVILNRTLVDMVCLGDRSLSDVLKAHGWAAKGDTREALRKTLASILDCMRGYTLRAPQDMS
ncbi:hypothetical protein QKW60_05635 [Defluviimonas aestuarii]|uniref:hypothetical protein n=1 Tax=Albidovulum aestuarii TaxID=1130726 RepID=UPI00249C393E|nr:hypothetical protein [Defluviimonas aestuarii]MDI3335878.1 hypothetical protein [Defluviimonas aestuarii]